MSELYHYGIKGQKWGVRRYQNEDGSYTPEGYKHYGRKLPEYGGKGIKGALYEAEKGFDVPNNGDYIIKKGTVYERVTTNPNEKFKDRMYVSGGGAEYDEWMKDVDGTTYVDLYKTKKDVVIAGKKTMISILNQIGGEKVDKIINSLNSDYWTPDGSSYNEKVHDDEDGDTYNDFLFKDKYKIGNAFVKELKKRGYDGLADPVDSGILDGLDPDATIFVNDVLKKVGQTKI